MSMDVISHNNKDSKHILDLKSNHILNFKVKQNSKVQYV